MAYQAKILADSVSELGHRLTTFEVTFPRCVLAEFNTHRMLSRNSASSRAIPVTKQLRLIMAAPFVPDEFGINQAGMQSAHNLEGAQHAEAEVIWGELGRNRAVVTALQLLLGIELFGRHFPRSLEGYVPSTEELTAWLSEHGSWLGRLAAGKLSPEESAGALNVHKQLANRVLESYAWHTVITTGTEWSNFFALRTDTPTQRQLRVAALLMRDAMDASTPQLVRDDMWHLPLVNARPNEPGNDYVEWRLNPDPRFWAKVSAARCARVSYLTHDTGQRDTAKDLELYERLAGSGHMSPLEHPARPMTAAEFKADPRSGNFRGWHQFRKDIPDEDDFAKVLARSNP